ncbi:MAG: hypothetical protein IJI97_09835 [Clostridia bacterium]|nr:hypothetical protein [Clostridia bacterium]
MKGFIQVRADVAGYGDHVQVLVNTRSIELVVRTSWGCEIRLPSRILQVTDAYEDVIARIEAAEAKGSRKPADRPVMGTAARERQGEAAPQRRRGQWEAGKDGWPFCPFCGAPADIDREEFRMKGDVRAAETPFCPTCGARLAGRDAGVQNE